jgi:hypothetical protein
MSDKLAVFQLKVAVVYGHGALTQFIHSFFLSLYL